MTFVLVAFANLELAFSSRAQKLDVIDRDVFDGMRAEGGQQMIP